MTTKPILTFSDLETLLDYCNDRERITYLPLLNDVCSTFHINTPTRVAMFFAQLEILTNKLKDISAYNESILSENSSIITASIENMFYPLAFIWSVKDCNSSSDVGLFGLVTKKLCGNYDQSVEKLKVYSKNKDYYK